MLSNQLASFKRPLIQTQLGWETSNKKEWGANAELRVEVKYKFWPRCLPSRTTSNSCLRNWSWSGKVPELFRLRWRLSQQLAYGKRDPLPLPTNTEQDPEDQSILGSLIYSGIVSWSQDSRLVNTIHKRNKRWDNDFLDHLEISTYFAKLELIGILDIMKNVNGMLQGKLLSTFYCFVLFLLYHFAKGNYESL